MSEAGLWVPRRQRTAKIYQPRNRRHCVGELIQIDGSDHHWFEERDGTPIARPDIRPQPFFGLI